MLDDNKLYCIQCGKERELGRRYCKECHKKVQRERFREKYKTKGRYRYTITCMFCNELYNLAVRKDQKFCENC